MALSSLSCGVLVLLLASCRASDVAVEFRYSDAHPFSRAERREIETIAQSTFAEVRKVLPGLPRPLHLSIEAGEAVIPETGESGSAGQPDQLHWIVDTRRPEGTLTIAKRVLHGTLAHELYHLERGRSMGWETLMDVVVHEGLATVFERDFAGVPLPWGEYPAEAAQWLSELEALPPDADRAQWVYGTVGGRRWMGLRAGTYLVDCALKAHGGGAASLVAMPTESIRTLCSEEQRGK
jgi:uncharacterized protein YjaZ